MDSILIVDDDERLLSDLSSLLESRGYHPVTASDGDQAVRHIRSHAFDLVLLDMVLPDIHGLELIRIFNRLAPYLPVIVITAFADYDACIEFLKLGAYYYIEKPVSPEKILPICRQAIDKARSGYARSHSGCIGVKLSNGVQIITQDVRLKALLGRVDKIAAYDLTVALEAETGSGKELIARLIHEKSGRKGMPFVAVNCGAIPETLAESELFGHEKGAFSGAAIATPGLFESANGGSLYLDEITNLPWSVQNKVLRSIENKTITHLGGTSTINLDVRFIVSTNTKFYDEVKRGKFREDLYHRINDVTLILPPLRERKEDIMLLADHFLEEYNSKHGKAIKDFSAEVKELLLSYSWPGNVRQLKKTVQYATLMTESDYIIPSDLPDELLQPILGLDLSQFESVKVLPSLDDVVRKVKQKYINKALDLTNGNKSKAAILLGIDRRALYREMEKLGNNCNLGSNKDK